MSYQVLARKWRPRTFRDLVGQEHVLQALVNALDHDRLHHAYLFTGTRGVGKTTIARILAKCLNCETGVSSAPCDQCTACREIAENRFVDLIEVDAASRTKVEDTRELLENVQYAPTRGRYKVYLIDEVHMLSAHSFNALLKTLEEPPPHVKFLLATTDPQKLPVTILSRCLQFNLKNMTPELVVGHLQRVLEKELIPFEEAALWQLGRAADGSMRDALSLTDQAIAFGSGKVTAAEVGAMLGAVDRTAVYAIIDALAEGDAQAALSAVAQMAEQAPDYASALADMLSILHRIAIGQALPEAVDNSQGDREQVLGLAQRLAPEDVQLFYQTALLGRRDLPLVPDPRAGLEMVLLRMLAFRPQGVSDIPVRRLRVTETQAPSPSSATDTAALSKSPENRPPEEETPIPAEEPSALNEEPSALEQKPSTVEQEPSAVEQEPSAQSREPSAQNQEPSAHNREPSAQNQEPSAQKQEPSAQEKQPSAPANETSALAAKPSTPAEQTPPPLKSPQESPDSDTGAPAEANTEGRSESLAKAAAETEIASLPAGATAASAPQDNRPPWEAADSRVPSQAAAGASAPPANARPRAKQPVAKISLAATTPESWPQIYLGLNLGGVIQSTASNCELLLREGNHFHFRLDESASSLYDEGHQQRLADVLRDYYSAPVEVSIEIDTIATHTPAGLARAQREKRLSEAVAAVKADPVVQQLVAHFDAMIDEGSIEPIDS